MTRQTANNHPALTFRIALERSAYGLITTPVLLIAMGYVMSNWPDRECSELLRKAHAACDPGGRVLIMDRLFDDGRDGPIATAVMNLEMLVETRGPASNARRVLRAVDGRRVRRSRGAAIHA